MKIAGCDQCDHGFVVDGMLGGVEVVRPCAVCMPEQYERWTAGKFEPSEETFPQGRPRKAKAATKAPDVAQPPLRADLA